VSWNSFYRNIRLIALSVTKEVNAIYRISQKFTVTELEGTVSIKEQWRIKITDL